MILRNRFFLVLLYHVIGFSFIVAQNVKKNELSLYSSLGLSSLSVSPQSIESKKSTCFGAGIGYNYYFLEKWSIGCGLEFDFSSYTFFTDRLSISYATNDGEYDFVFNTTFQNHKETGETVFLGFPLFLRFQLPINQKFQYYISSGVKVQFPVSGRYISDTKTIESSGYYETWNVTLDSPEFMGFGIFNNHKSRGKIPLQTCYYLTLDTGIKWASNYGYVYTGIFVDYGLNNITKISDKELCDYNLYQINSFQIKNLLETNKLDKAIPYRIGIKINISLSV